MHLCPDEVVALTAFLAAGPLLVYRFCRHQVGCFCRWCARKIRRT